MIRTNIFDIEICRLSIWHFVKSIPGFPVSRYRLQCQMCTEYQTFPHPQSQHTAKGLLLKIEIEVSKILWVLAGLC